MTQFTKRLRFSREISKTLRVRGFSLAELLVAMAVFLVISAAAFTLVQKHIPLFMTQQNQVALNYAMRNAAAQFQMDIANAGAGYYVGANVPSAPLGLIAVNNIPTQDCHDAATYTYGPGCFDELRIVTFDLKTPLAHPTDSGANCVSRTSSNVFITPIVTTPPTQLSDLAADFKEGDIVLLMKSDGSQMATAVLTKDGQVTGGKVKLQHNPTGTEDPLGVFASPTNNKLGNTFCSSDWVLKISPNYVTYSVDTTDSSNPKLVRWQGTSGVKDIIAEQIIGFKVGASLWNDASGTDLPYNFDASTYSYSWNDIRSVRVSLIGRTPPEPGSRFRNTFDHGPYRIQSMSVVVSPRNLSMND